MGEIAKMVSQTETLFSVLHNLLYITITLYQFYCSYYNYYS